MGIMVDGSYSKRVDKEDGGAIGSAMGSDLRANGPKGWFGGLRALCGGRPKVAGPSVVNEGKKNGH